MRTLVIDWDNGENKKTSELANVYAVSVWQEAGFLSVTCNDPGKKNYVMYYFPPSSIYYMEFIETPES